MKTEFSISVLRNMFNDQDLIVRLYAVNNCNGDKDIIALAMEDKDYDVRVAAVKACNGDKDVIAKAMKDEDYDIRVAAVEACNGDKDIIAKAMGDEDCCVRVAAVKACNGDKDIIAKAMKDEDYDVRVAAVEACNGDKDTIMKAIKDEDWFVRYSAIKACNGDKDILMKAIKDENPYVRKAFRTFNPPDKVYKKCLGGVIIVAKIPEDAYIRGSFKTKCRTNKVEIIDIIGDFYGEKVGISQHDPDTQYHIGDKVTIDNFDFSNEECAPGFHFFCNLELANNYNYR